MHGAGRLEELIKRRGWARGLGDALAREEPGLAGKGSGAGANVSESWLYLVVLLHLALVMNTALGLTGHLLAGIVGVLFRELVALV